MLEMTLKCEDLLPHVYVTAKCTYRYMVHDGGVEIEIVRVVLAAEDGTPSAQELPLRPFITDMGLERLERLMGRFADEAMRRVHETVEADLNHYRDKVFAAMQLPASMRKDFP